MTKEKLIFLTTKDNNVIKVRYANGISHLTKYHLMEYFKDNRLFDILHRSYRSIRCEDANGRNFDTIIIDDSIKRDYYLINNGGGKDFIAVINQLKKERKK